MTPSQMQAVARVLGADSARFMFRGDDGTLVRLPATVADDGSLFYALLLKLAERGRLPCVDYALGRWEAWLRSDEDHDKSQRGIGHTPLSALAAAVEGMEGGT